MHYQPSRKFIKLAALSTIVTIGLSSLVSQPGLALSLVDQAWAEGFGIPLHTINDAATQAVEDDSPAGFTEATLLAASENPLVTREEAVLSIQAFADTIVRIQLPVESALRSYELSHRNIEGYLADRIVGLTSDTNRLLGQTQAKSCSGTPKQASTQPHLPSDIDPDAFYADAVRYLSDRANLNLTFDDGTFRPNDYLTQAQYLDYLQQIERLIAQRYDEESLLTLGDPTEWVTNSEGAEWAGTALFEVLDRLATVSALVEDLRALQNKEHLKGNLKENLSGQIAELEQSFITSMSELPDVSPADSVYEPLQILVEEYGFDPILTAGEFSSQTPMTRGEAAIYLMFAIDGTQIIRAGDTLSLVTGDYRSFSESLQGLEQALNSAITQYE